MTKTTTAASKAKTTERAASSFTLPDHGVSKFEMAKFDLPSVEMPAAFREIAEKGVEQTKDTYAKAKVASEEAADLLENTYEAAVKWADDYNRRLFAIARTNTRAAFDNVHELLDAKSPSELIELSTAQMRKQFDIVSTQNKELCALAQEMATSSLLVQAAATRAASSSRSTSRSAIASCSASGRGPRSKSMVSSTS
jgi:phasin